MKRFLPSRRSFFLAISLFILFLNLGNFISPVGKDQGIFGYVGQRIAAGELPYRDIWDHKPPAIFYVYALVEKAFPDSLPAQRTASVLASIVSAVLMFFLARRFFSEGRSMLASGIFAFFMNCRTISEGGALTETYMVIFTIAAYYAAVRFFFNRPSQKNLSHTVHGPSSAKRRGVPERRGEALEPLHFAGLSGIAIGIAFLFKPVAAVSLITMGVFLLYVLVTKKMTFSAFFIGGTLFVLGFMLPNALVALWFAHQGILTDYLNCAYLYNAQYIKNNASSLSYVIGNIKDALILQGIGSAVLWVGALFGMFVIAMNKKRTPQEIFIIVLCIFDAIGTSAGMRFYGHYFMQMIPSAVLLFTVWLSRPIRKTDKNINNVMRTIIIALSVVAILAQLAFIARAVYRYTTSQQQNTQQQVAQYVKEMVQRDQTIYVPGMETPVYYLSHTKAPTKYVHDDFLYKMTTSSKNAVIDQIIAAKPVYIVVFENYYLAPLGRLPVVMTQSYHLEKKIDTVQLYRRNRS